ncbi:MAG: acylneuraminate cytidylyltransferase family protein [Gammaproteobacteria bacterium]|nr:acylneuraminate cytidylyltransferase family protein [Gammaproteobacteria bacterium]
MIEGRRIVAIVPARGGSKGVPRKNLREFQGDTLVARTVKSALKSQYIDRVIVSSEDPEILAEAKRAGADVPFVRPFELAQDTTPGVDPILHALQEIEPFDVVVLLQVTSPLRTTADIDACILHFHEHQAPACVSVVEPDKHPYLMVTANSNGRLIPFVEGDKPTRRQDYPRIYALNGAIYVAQTDWLKTHKTFLTEETLGFVMPKERSVDIDHESDFAVLAAYANYLGELG